MDTIFIDKEKAELVTLLRKLTSTRIEFQSEPCPSAHGHTPTHEVSYTGRGLGLRLSAPLARFLTARREAERTMGVRGEAPPAPRQRRAGPGPGRTSPEPKPRPRLLGFGASGPAAAHPAGAWSSDSRREARRWPDLRGAASQQRRDCLYSVPAKKKFWI